MAIGDFLANSKISPTHGYWGFLGDFQKITNTWLNHNESLNFGAWHIDYYNPG